MNCQFMLKQLQVPQAIKHFINVLLLISFLYALFLSDTSQLLFFYFQVMFNINYEVFQLQRGTSYLLIIDASQCQSVVGRNRNFLYLLITINKGFKSFHFIFKFEALRCLLMLLLSDGLNAIYLSLRDISTSVINAYLANLMYTVIFYCFLEQWHN